MSEFPERPGLPQAFLGQLALSATRLSERVAAIDSYALPVDPEAVARATALVEFWNQVFSPGDRDAFLSRLKWDGLDWIAALAAAVGTRKPTAEVPEWTDWLNRFAGGAAEVQEDLAAGALPEAAPDRWTEEPPFVEIWTAVLRAARRALAARLPVSIRADIDARAVWAFERQLVGELAIWGERAVFDAFCASAAPAPGGHGARAPDAYERFVSGLLGAGLTPLWTRWPVLARQLATVTACWVDSTCELLARLDRDRPAIAAAFGAGQDPGPLTWVNPALSDPHHGRRRVSALGFASGLRIVYKPRDLSLDRAFNDLLGWLAARGLRPAPRALQVLEREGYGWVEFASTEPLRSSDEARAYFEQAGSLICIAHVFRGRDFHMDNLVATRQGPVLVDLEPLLQPASVANGADRVQSDEETPPAAAGESCLATGLLHLYELGPDGGMFDVGGLSGTGVGTRTIPRRVWRNQRTNALRFDEELAFATAGLNLARRDGRIEQPDSHARDILAGFTRAYRVIARERPALLAAGGPLSGLVSCRVRVIPRPTNQYALLSTALAAPRYQDDGMRHGAALDILLRPFGRHSKRPAIWPALAEERRALESLDIPYFWVRADDTDVRAGGHMVAANYFATSGLSAVRERLGALCERDLDAECGILARAMSESPRSRFSATFPAAGAADQSDTRSQPFVDAAVWIGRELLARARDVPGGIGWPRLDRHEPDIVGPHALYDGSSGVALFFGALHRCTGESRWADVARQTAAPIHDAIRRGEFAAWRGDAIGIGDGLGSIVYGLVCLSRLIEDDAALDRAFDIATLIASRIADNRRDDVLSGAAGALIALLVLHRVRPDTRLVQWASDLGAQLVARQQRVGPVSTWPAADGQPLLGFAHGAAGIAFALSRLHAEAASAPVAEAAARGMRFVGERFVPAQGNWPVSASSTGVAGTAFMTAWCHGAPGIALAIAATDGCVDGARAELRAALTTSATWRPGRADHLCCGTLGRADILLTLGRRLVLEESIGAARALGLRVTDRARQAGHFRLSVPGPEYRVFEPGFFRGLSGIGYALLRLGTETSLPSILACESPVP